MDAKTLRSVSPFVKEYALNRGVHPDQPANQNGVSTSIHNAIAGYVDVSENSLMLKRTPVHASFCYGTLNRLVVPNTKALLLQVQDRKEDLPEDAFRHYIHWVLNLSPWRHVFVTKNVNRILSTGVVVVDPDQKGNTVSGGMIALRQAWENYCGNGRYRHVGVWFKMIDKLDPNVAFAITNSLFDFKGGTTATRITGGIGHTPIEYYDREDYRRTLDNFLAGNLVDDSRPWKLTNVPSASQIWKVGSDRPVKKAFGPIVHGMLSMLDKKAAKVNPFARAEGASNVYGTEELIDLYTSELPEVMRKAYG